MISVFNNYMEKTYSQKVARVFEIVDYFMLFPAGIGALVGLVFLSKSPGIAFLIYAILAVGIALMVGYFKHSRGTLDESYFSALWITTAIYNFIPLLPCLYFASTLLQPRDEYGEGGSLFGFVIIATMTFGYLAAVLNAIAAYSFDKQRTATTNKYSIVGNP